MTQKQMTEQKDLGNEVLKPFFTCCFTQLKLFLVDTVWFQESFDVPVQARSKLLH